MTTSRQNFTTQHFDALMSRYESIIPNATALATTLQSPLPQCAWYNPLKLSQEAFNNTVCDRHFQATPLAWWKHGFRYQGDTALGKTWAYLCGLIQIQEEVSMLPALILNPQPGDTVLDMCAAPGNKTAQASILMNNTGAVFANDSNLNRLRATGQIIKRLGLLNINIAINDGVQFPVNTPYFDKVIVDAPCSCEGTLRKSLLKPAVINPGNSQRLAQTQIALLKKAIKIAKPGGTIVYSTCTFSPEENEAVIDTLLKQHANEITLLPIRLKHFQASPGITHWQGRHFNPELTKTWRVWPHLNNTGGFFIALLQKIGVPPEKKQIMQPPKPSSDRVKTQLAALKERFGFTDNLLQQFHYLDHSKRGLFITSADNTNTDIKRDCSGLFFIKTKIRFPKISSSMAMLWSEYAKTNVVHLEKHQIALFLQKQDITLPPKQREHCTNTGYVIVKYCNIGIGLGIVFARDPLDDWPLRSLFPGYLS